MTGSQQQAAVSVICDLRQFNVDVTTIGALETVWQQASNLLVGKPLVRGGSISVQLSQGTMVLWVVDTPSTAQVDSSTTFNVKDVLRNAKLVYRCRVCGEYGPLRCSKCEEEKRPERLCSNCARFIKDELSAYCPDHVPPCSECTRPATFRCSRCHKLYGQHMHRQKPGDPDTDYCQRCYQILFEQCGVCAAAGKFSLGKSKCAFKTRTLESACAKPLCWEHSFQWKIWGPHNRGVTLCEQHKDRLEGTDVADLLYMMLTARPPYAQRGKRQSLPNPFRLRRIINRNRAVPLTFDQIGYALRTLSSQINDWGEQAKRSYDYMFKTFQETVGGLSQIESDLLTQIRAFYQRSVGWEAASQIAGIEIIDRFYKPGQPARYRVRLQIGTANKGPYIGRGGATINQLRSQLNKEMVELRSEAQIEEIRASTRSLSPFGMTRLNVDRGSTNISGGLIYAAGLLNSYSQEGNEKMIVLLSDGADWVEDTDSKSEGEIVSTAHDPAVLADNLHYDSQIRIHTVAISSEQALRQYEDRAYWDKKWAVPNVKLLQKIADFTEGLFFERPDARVLAKLLDEIGEGAMYPI